MLVEATVIRPATQGDLPSILDIYNHAVLHTTATADYEPRSIVAQQSWYEQRVSSGYPVLAAEMDGAIVGWAALSPYQERPGYRFTAEDSVYVASEWQGKGIGKRLLRDLLSVADTGPYHVVLAKIDASNDASIHLHEAFGFEKVGYYKEVIFKFDRWLDVVHLQRLCPCATNS